MKEKGMEQWQELSTVYIPPLESEGFTEHVLHRKIWNRTMSEKKTEAQPKPEPSEEHTQLLLNESMAEEDRDQTMLLAPELKAQAYIVRMDTNERIDIDKEVFIIGKSVKADYQLHGNEAISRKHVQIVQKEGHYYLIDLNSLNHTYVNGQELLEPATMESGMKFKMADEMFCFYIEALER